MRTLRLNPDGLFSVPGLSQCVTVPESGLVFLSGQVAWDHSGALVGEGSHEAQMQQIVHNVDTALAAVGTSRDSVLKETLYVVDYRADLLPVLMGPLRAGIPSAPPASTLVAVNALFAPGFLVEVDIIATTHRTRLSPDGIGRATDENSLAP